MSKTEAEMVACARRELILRKNVYPRWIKEGRMTAEKAQYEIECMEDICAVLEKYKMLGEVSEEMKEMERRRQIKMEQPNLNL